MLKIKLARFGKTKQPHYRFVINEAREKRDGKYVDVVGHYAPTQTPKLLEVDVVKYEAWLKKGAQPTDTVAMLFKRFQSGNPFPARPAKPSKKAKAKAAAVKEAQAAEAEKAAAPTPEATPAPEATSPEVPVETASPAETPTV
jgi:small subunit ribosomal protein S16